MNPNQNKKTTIVGTNIDDVKEKNSQAGMSYNEAKSYIARTTGGYHTDFLSDTNKEAVREQNKKSQANVNTKDDDPE